VVFLPIREQEAAERQRKAGKEGGRGRKKNLTQKIGEGLDRHEREAAAQAAKKTGANRQYVAAAKKLQEEDHAFCWLIPC
jgi:hypothetical protein